MYYEQPGFEFFFLSNGNRTVFLQLKISEIARQIWFSFTLRLLIVYIYVYNFFELFFCFLAASNLLFYIDKNGEKCKSLIQSSKIQMV